MKVFGFIIGIILLLLLGVSFPASILILAITWLIVHVVAKSNDSNRQKPKNNNIPINDEVPPVKLLQASSSIQPTEIQELPSLKGSMSYSNNSIVDVTGEYYKLGEAKAEVENEDPVSDVPYWEHTYIYSTDSLKWSATDRIRKFYFKFKKDFLNGKYYNLNGNSNYPFTLMFDLLQEYDKHPDLRRLTNQMQALIEHYPETRYYAERELIGRVKKFGKRRTHCMDGEVSIDDVVELFRDSREWTFADKFAEKLKLTPEEITIFNYIESKQGFYYTDIDFMPIKITELFRNAINQLELKYSEESKTLRGEFKRIANLMSLRYHSNSYSDKEKDPFPYKINEIYNCIFRLCHDKLHRKYGFGYNDIDIYYSVGDENRKILVANLMPLVRSILKESLSSFPELSDDEEIIVNKHYNTRWRPKFQEITENYNNDLSCFIEEANRLVKQNSKNHGVGYLLFDASKFLVGKDNIAALKMYLRYIDVFRKVLNNNENPLPKYICKKLFKKAEQQDEFEDIVRKYKKDGDRKEANEAIDQLFLPKRKKLNLDREEIIKISEQHSETVLLLNEVMSEEEIAASPAEAKQNIIEPDCNASDSVLPVNALLDSHHMELLAIFAHNNHSLTKSQVVDFAKYKGLMANRLVDKINELCYDTLDDVLIENEDDNWTISEDYLKKIIA